jgi:hypothetical protein
MNLKKTGLSILLVLIVGYCTAYLLVRGYLKDEIMDHPFVKNASSNHGTEVAVSGFPFAYKVDIAFNPNTANSALGAFKVSIDCDLLIKSCSFKFPNIISTGNNMFGESGSINLKDAIFKLEYKRSLALLLFRDKSIKSTILQPEITLLIGSLSLKMDEKDVFDLTDFKYMLNETKSLDGTLTSHNQTDFSLAIPSLPHKIIFKANAQTVLNYESLALKFKDFSISYNQASFDITGEIKSSKDGLSLVDLNINFKNLKNALDEFGLKKPNLFAMTQTITNSPTAVSNAPVTTNSTVTTNPATDPNTSVTANHSVTISTNNIAQTDQVVVSQSNPSIVQNAQPENQSPAQSLVNELYKLSDSESYSPSFKINYDKVNDLNLIQIGTYKDDSSITTINSYMSGYFKALHETLKDAK